MLRYIYILYLIQQDSSFSVIESSFYAINFYHLFLNLEGPCKSPVVKSMLEAPKRVKHHRTRKKKAITVEQIKKIYDNCIKTKPNIYNMRTFTLVNLSFCDFLRYSEALNIRRSDIDFQSSHMKIFIEKSKTDIYRNRNWIYIARGNSELCPVATLQRYLNMTEINEYSDKFIFRSITSHRNHQHRTLREKNVPLSYTTARELFLNVVTALDMERGEFSLHSLRSGGVSTAANAGVNDRLFKSHGRWRSESAKDSYVDDNIEALLTVSRMLGL